MYDQCSRSGHLPIQSDYWKHNLAFANWKHLRRFTPSFATSHMTAEDRCSIHAESPYSCAMFDHTQSREEADALNLRGLMEIARAWQRGGLYARLWLLLHHGGRIAPSPIEARARMRAALAAEECAGEDRTASERQWSPCALADHTRLSRPSQAIHLNLSMDTPSTADRLGWRGNCLHSVYTNVVFSSN